MSRKHPDSYERDLPNRRRDLIELLEILAPYTDDPYEFDAYCEAMDELDEVESEMHIRPQNRYRNRDSSR